MNHGLSPFDYEFLIRNLVKPLKEKGAQVFLFGSRATGKYRKFSDIDILYTASQSLTSAHVYEILSSMEESSFPYKIDLVRADELAQSYRDNIQREKVEL